MTSYHKLLIHLGEHNGSVVEPMCCMPKVLDSMIGISRKGRERFLSKTLLSCYQSVLAIMG